jgi:transmembrane sensor
MKKMKNIENFTDQEWEELASILSNEKTGQTELLNRFSEGDINNSGEMWNELSGKDQKEIDVDKAWRNVQSRIGSPEIVQSETTARTRFLSPVILRIAAVALILLAIGSVATYITRSGFLTKNNTVIAGNDQKNVLVDLPDGSKVYLNRNSEFTYNSNFGKKGRNVKLTGEAFFEITPDTKKPFIIDAGEASIKVVGTTFNVITKNSESAVEVFVKTGKVLVSDASGAETIQLDPGFVGTVNSKIHHKAVNSNPNYLSWKTGYLDYSGQKLDVVFSDLKRVYNMDIVADDPSILENPWHSPIDNLSQETIIRLICGSFNLSYTKDGNVYHLTKK